MIPKRVLRALSIVAGPLLIAVAGSAMAAGKPNIVLINMDNFGYGELGVYGAEQPWLDQSWRPGEIELRQ